LRAKAEIILTQLKVERRNMKIWNWFSNNLQDEAKTHGATSPPRKQDLPSPNISPVQATVPVYAQVMKGRHKQGYQAARNSVAGGEGEGGRGRREHQLRPRSLVFYKKD
jgi:hypothetical protein